MKFEQVAKHIYTIEGFLSPEECQEWIDKSETKGYEKAYLEVDGKKIERKEIRNNQRILWDDNALANQFFDKAKQHLPQSIGNSHLYALNNLFRFYKYGVGQQFRRHKDDSYIQDDRTASYYTFLIYLNDDYEGGSTQFSTVDIAPKAGKCLIFFHQLEHAGNPITKGVKYVFRTDIMYRLAL